MTTEEAKDYAQQYGVSRATIYNYQKAGINLADAQAVRRHQVSIRTRTRVTSRHKSQAGVLPKTPDDIQAVALPGGAGLRANIERLRAMEIQLGNEAAQKRDILVLNKWLAVSEQLRKAEASTPDVERLNDESLPVDEVRQTWAEAAAGFRSALDALPGRTALELVGLDLPQIELRLKAAVNELLGSLAKGI